MVKEELAIDDKELYELIANTEKVIVQGLYELANEE